MSEWLTYGMSDLSRALGRTPQFDAFSHNLICDSYDWRYHYATELETNEQAQALLKAVATLAPVVESPVNQAHWDARWSQEVARKSILTCFHTSRVLRWGGNFIFTTADDFEAQWYSVFAASLFRMVFGPVERIYEFGSGGGVNLLILSELFPDKVIYGLDWADSSLAKTARLADMGRHVYPHHFNMLNPECGFHLAPSSGVLTVGAIEQLGDDFEPFMDYLIGEHPAVVLNLEPVIENYDETNLVDFTAVRHHEKRGYAIGVKPYLVRAVRDGVIRDLWTYRTGFGSQFIEGYSQLIWR